MIRPPYRWRSAAVLGVAATTLAACGGGSSGGTTGQSSSAASAASSAASSASSAGSASSSAGSASASASASGSAAAAGGAQGDGELVVGTLLPQTGSLAFLGPPEFAGVDLAVKEINAAGGVLGKPIKKFDSDSGDTANAIASQSVDRLFGNKVDAIVGAASSSVSLSVIDKITGAGVLQISPANTSEELTDYNDKGLYFRTAPPDKLQGRVLGDTIAGDGAENLGILALQDSYGEGLSKSTKESFEGGGGKVVENIIYDPKAANYSAEVSKMKAASPDAIALIGFDETKKIVPELVRQGIGPDKVKLYFVDGNLADYSKDLKAGTLKGTKGTLPGAKTGESLQKKLLGVNPKLKDFSYGPESYDATVLVALAAEAAKSDSGKDIAAKMVEISKEGTKCTAFKECKDLIAKGEDIDYDGVSGPVEFDDNGNPAEATMGIYEYGADNKYKNVDYVTGKVAE